MPEKKPEQTYKVIVPTAPHTGGIGTWITLFDLF